MEKIPDKVICFVTKKEYDINHCYKADLLREQIFNLIKKDFPDLNYDCYISIEEVNEYRKKYLTQLVEEEKGELWIMTNVLLLIEKSFDPYPFILLNLILSCLAAIQAPIIMMSQNRKEQKDRIRGEHDYMVNLKSELEIKLLNEKVDHLIIHQNKRLLEIQQLQMDYLEDILKELKVEPKT